MNETTPRNRGGRPALFGQRDPLVIRVSRPLHEHLTTKAALLGYSSLSDYVWALLNEASGFDSETTLPYADYKAVSNLTATAPGADAGIVPLRDRTQITTRIPAALRKHLTAKAVAIGYRSLNDYAWALLNEASGFDGIAPLPRDPEVVDGRRVKMPA